MSKYLTLLTIMIAVSTNIAIAQTTVQQIQSPIYKDEIGRSHFLGKGGYSTVRHIQMDQAQADVVNDATMKFSEKKAEPQKAEPQNIEKKSTDNIDITTVIKEKQEVPTSAKTKATFTTENRQMDPSASFGQGATYIPDNSGVNDSKTIYKDDLGRLHFFGKGNLIKE